MKLPGLGTPRLGRPRLGTPRLLPVVIFAGVSLLLFKGIGIVTQGGYVLSGTSIARAADATGASPDASNGGSSADSPAPHTEPTLADSSPTLTDTAPTIGATPAADAPAAKPAAGASMAPAATTAAPAGATIPVPVPPPLPGSLAASLTCPPVAATPATPGGSDASATGADQTGSDQPSDGLQATNVSPGCAVDAVPTKLDADGHPVPLAGPDGVSLTQATLLQRLADRRTELDKRAADLNLREAIVQAAEKQMSARADALKALEAQITALSDQKQAMEDQQFAGVVKMYEAMKPQDAAGIFDGLDMNVLLRVARAMDPRKMSPILAKMTAARAQELTTQLAAVDPQKTGIAPVAAADPNALPQIVGQ